MLKPDNLKLSDLITPSEIDKIDYITIENNFLLHCTEITLIYKNNTFRDLENIEGINLDHKPIIKELRSKFKEESN